MRCRRRQVGVFGQGIAAVKAQDHAAHLEERDLVVALLGGKLKTPAVIEGSRFGDVLYVERHPAHALTHDEVTVVFAFRCLAIRQSPKTG